MAVYGALEAGGTKMVLARFTEVGEMTDRVSIPTETPGETMPRMIEYFKAHPVDALGIACFGPVSLNPNSENYGSITTTPKTAWRDYPIMTAFRDALGIPVMIDTDVNAAALAEGLLGAGKGKSVVLYVTVGTGIGGGILIDQKPLHGLMHPEFGHILLTPSADDPAPDGFCPYHKHCLEGLASGPALLKRWGVMGQCLSPDHPAWKLEAHYLAQMCHNALTAFSPEVIILGGGVMGNKALFPAIRRETAGLLNNYIGVPAVTDGLESVIVPPALEPDSGIIGAYLLAKQAM